MHEEKEISISLWDNMNVDVKVTFRAHLRRCTPLDSLWSVSLFSFLLLVDYYNQFLSGRARIQCPSFREE